ncbi:hypothetical protein HDU91_001056, partial [Kappamyces sp. JEL0680]
EPFLSLPNPDDYPDYYEVITQPISLETIRNSIQEGKYDNVDASGQAGEASVNIWEFKNDIVAISSIYKDAKSLLDSFDSHLEVWSGVEKEMRKVKAILDSFSTLLIDDGSDVASFFMSLPPSSQTGLEERLTTVVYYSKVKNPISLSDISRKVEDFKYGVLLTDLHLLANNAISFFGPDSNEAKAAQLIKDAVKDIQDDDQDDPNDTAAFLPGTELNELEIKGEVYRVGDFAYFKNDEEPDKPTIGQIFNLFQTGSDSAGLRVVWFFRPEQTTHKANTKFIEKEVLRTSHFENYSMNELIGRCQVLYVKDYVRGRVRGIPSEHTYVCENRYNMHAKTQTKLKSWQTSQPESVRGMEVELELFSTPLVLVRAPLEYNPADTPSSPPQGRKRKKEAISYAEDDEDEEPELKRGRGSVSSTDVSSQKGGFNFAQMSKTTKDLIARMHSQRPVYHVPAPLDPFTLPKGIIEAFDNRGDGKVRWFTAPPLDVVKDGLLNSLEYEVWKAKRAAAKKLEQEDTIMAVDPVIEPALPLNGNGDTGALVQALKGGLSAANRQFSGRFLTRMHSLWKQNCDDSASKHYPVF